MKKGYLLDDVFTFLFNKLPFSNFPTQARLRHDYLGNLFREMQLVKWWCYASGFLGTWFLVS